MNGACGTSALAQQIAPQVTAFTTVNTALAAKTQAERAAQLAWREALVERNAAEEAWDTA